MIQLVRIEDGLPEGFERLRAEAAAEGHRHMDRLAAEWAAGEPRFVALLAALAGGGLAGIGGLTVEPEPSEEPALRMRRLYVGPAHRRDGVGRAIATALIQEAFGQTALITVHAGGDAAAAFWEAQGFTSVANRPWSHQLRR
ncbi:GNAT family N-acetyltransferase [Phenylobacterium aquaticum]|uniref:GNAT family N-acetyltransferase n=1 Tax=Phenylobacterium aquaticum TaxID=1763816 RepID=UPI0026F079B6|nr:GNAT family N-acetyltransferase [Phenylobacterium aquaticum]